MAVSKLCRSFQIPRPGSTSTLQELTFPGSSHPHPFPVTDAPPSCLRLASYPASRGNRTKSKLIFRFRRFEFESQCFLIMCPWVRFTNFPRFCFLNSKNYYNTTSLWCFGDCQCYLWKHFPHHGNSLRWFLSFNFNFKPSKYSIFPSPQGLATVWGCDLVQALQTCDLTLFHVSSITTFSDNIPLFSSRLFCLLLSLPTFPGFYPQPSLFLSTTILARSSAPWSFQPRRRMWRPHLQPWNMSPLVP